MNQVNCLGEKAPTICSPNEFVLYILYARSGVEGLNVYTVEEIFASKFRTDGDQPVVQAGARL